MYLIINSLQGFMSCGIGLLPGDRFGDGAGSLPEGQAASFDWAKVVRPAAVFQLTTDEAAQDTAQTYFFLVKLLSAASSLV